MAGIISDAITDPGVGSQSSGNAVDGQGSQVPGGIAADGPNGMPRNPKDIAALIPYMTDDQLAALDHSTLYMARQYLPHDQQNRISPFEHRAFAREATAENPALAIPIAVASLAYQPYKMLNGARSDPDVAQVGGAWKGIGEGILQRVMGQRSR